MATRPLLIVVVVEDADIRSMLAERLAAQGANLLTASGWRDGLLERSLIREPAILVVEEAAVAGEGNDWIEAQRDQWRQVVMLTVDPPEARESDGWLVSVHRRSAGRILPQLFADWVQAGGA